MDISRLAKIGLGLMLLGAAVMATDWAFTRIQDAIKAS